MADKKSKKKTTKKLAKNPPLKTKVAKVKEKIKTKSQGQKKQKGKEEEKDRKAMLRRALVKKREEIIKEAKEEISKYIKGETKQLIDTALDDGDWSVVDLSEDVSLRRLSAHRENLQKIDEALRKFDEGTYGICEECGEEISQERLKILPFAIYCIDCQEKKEQMEEIEKKEGIV